VRCHYALGDPQRAQALARDGVAQDAEPVR
jgi:hypothetical protein